MCVVVQCASKVKVMQTREDSDIEHEAVSLDSWKTLTSDLREKSLKLSLCHTGKFNKEEQDKQRFSYLSYEPSTQAYSCVPDIIAQGIIHLKTKPVDDHYVFKLYYFSW